MSIESINSWINKATEEIRVIDKKMDGLIKQRMNRVRIIEKCRAQLNDVHRATNTYYSFSTK